MSWDNLNTSWGESTLINVEKDTNDSGLEDLEDEKYRSYCEKTYQVITQIDEIGLPKQNEQLRLITFRSFNAALFLAHICQKEIVENIIIVVYSINGEAAKLINELILSGRIKKATILMSNLRNKAHRIKEQITRDLFVDNPNVDLFFCSSHAKIISMQTESGNYYTIEGSVLAILSAEYLEISFISSRRLLRIKSANGSAPNPSASPLLIELRMLRSIASLFVLVILVILSPALLRE